ncbi:MAG: NAD-dependent epimerase/dehydratase family protein [Candidatus Aenigmarchaeota archaeon]|nr:NAD-dependent epimerase/dehydratase family protein [Candidatus Aenigmarchaeota archaeon]
MRFVVTGGAGFIGSNLVERLIKEGNEVIVIDNLHTGSLYNLKGLNIKFIKGDAGEIDKIIDPIDGIFHLGIPSSSPMYKKKRDLICKAIEDWIKILEYATKNKVKIVLASTSSIYNGNPLPWREDMQIIPTDFYTEVRYTMERIAKVYNDLYGTRVVALRLFSVYGEKEEFKGEYANLVTQFILAALRGETIKVFGDGTQTRDFIYVQDVVEAFIRAMNSNIDFDIFNVGRGKSYSLNEVIAMVSRILDVEVRVKYIENPIKNYVWHTLADTAKAEEKLGFKARVDLEEGIRKITPYYDKIVKESKIVI